MRDKIISYMGFAKKSGNLVSGSNTCIFSIKKKKVRLLLITEDASENTKKKMTHEAESGNVPVRIFGESEKLSRAVGESGRTVFGITDGNFARVIDEEIRKGREQDTEDQRG